MARTAVQHVTAAAPFDRAARSRSQIGFAGAGDQDRQCRIGRAAVAVAYRVIENVLGDAAGSGDRSGIGIRVAIAAVGVQRQRAGAAADRVPDIGGRAIDGADAEQVGGSESESLASTPCAAVAETVPFSRSWPWSAFATGVVASTMR